MAAAINASKLAKLYGASLNGRDKALKVLQYFSRFLMGYYGTSLTDEGSQQLLWSVHTTLYMRRVSRLAFFINNISKICEMIEQMKRSKYSLSLSPYADIQDPRADGLLVNSVEVLEQFVWVCKELFMI
jgi:Peroxisomal biogenesis factor 11 (PEX11)